MTKFQKLTKKEKVEHIWEYYRFHILGGIIVVFMLSSLLFEIFGPQPPKPVVNVVIMGMYAHDDENVEKFKKEIEDIIDNGEQGKVEVNMFQVDWDSGSQMDMAMNQKLMLMFQAKEIDVMIIEENKYDSYIVNLEEGIYESLEDALELTQVLEDNKDKLVKRKLANDPQEKVYGLYAKDNIKLQSIGLKDDYVVSIPTISQHKDNAFKTIKWLYE
ncbi:MAG TPA: hypothetical protein GX707_06605 [Epulopiscium sp.]|nr:hypothetical protein [Candidatus Epulonipiscium sp.]